MTFPKSKLLELNNKNVSTGFCLSKKKNVPEHIELLIALTNAFLDVFLMYISIIQKKNVYFESSDLKFSFCNSKRDL